MGKIAFTKDEAILALDALLFSGEEHFSCSSKAVLELSQLLNELPIHSLSKRAANFRNPVGISDQISGFRHSLKDTNNRIKVGSVFFQAYEEHQDCLTEIHSIAMAIRRNKDFFKEHLFGDKLEQSSFPEGALLNHLHILLEKRDSKLIEPGQVCSICCLNLSEVYKDIPGNFMQQHLTVPVTELDSRKKYKPDDFITVCPNCHAVIHQIRPWISKENVGEILK